MKKSLRTTTLISLILLTRSVQAEQLPLVLSPKLIEERQIHSCAMNLLRASGKTGKATEKLPGIYVRASQDKGQDFMEYVLSVMYVESRFNKEAVSPKEARGLMQMTEIAVEEAHRGCSLPRLADSTKLHDSYTNVKYGTCFLKLMLGVAGGDWTRALILYNGGYRQLQKYNRGEPMAQETAEYIVKVEEARGVCRGSTVDMQSVK
jgi:soluble lytic murein transglycosylase-like protein